MDKISELEACQFLGITKELLYSYVTKKTNGKKLEVITHDKSNFFDKEILKEWDLFLKKPWVINSTDRRPPIPQHIKDYLKVECNAQCPKCGNFPPLEDAHIDSWSESLSHHHNNLIRLCSGCHTKYDQGYIRKQDIIELKSVLVQKIKDRLFIHGELAHKKRQHPEKIFIGREEELQQIIRWLTTTEKAFMINGIGGTGKTQLVLNALVESKKNIQWLNVHLFNNLSELQTHLFSLYEVANTNQLINSINENDLIVFDGYEKMIFENKDEAIDFLHNLLSYSVDKSKFIITSQYEIQDVRTQYKEIHLLEISLTDSETILNDLTNNNFENDPFLQGIVKLSHGHPLTIRIFAGLLNFFRSPEMVFKKIKELGITVVNDPARDSQNKSSSLEYCLILSYRQFSDDEKELIFYISCFPGGITDELLEILISNKKDKAIFQNKHQLDVATAKLRLFHLLKFEQDPSNERRIYLLNSVRSFILWQFSKNKIKKHKIRILAFKSLQVKSYFIYKYLLFSDNIDFGIMKMQLELPNYLYAIKRSIHSIKCNDCSKHSSILEYENLITSFANVLYKFLFTRGYFDYSLLLNLESAKIEMDRGNFDAAIEDLAQVYSTSIRLYNEEKAEEIYHMILDCEQRALIEINSATLYLIKGNYFRKTNPKLAIEIFEKGVKLEQSKLKKEDNNLAQLLSEIGWTHEKNLDDPKLALVYYNQAYELQKDTKDYQNMFSTSHNIANSHAELGNVEAAKNFYLEALTGFTQLGHRQYISNSFSELGELKTNNNSLDISSVFSEDIFESALKDIEFEIKEHLNDVFPDGSIPVTVLNKLFKSIKLVSFSENGEKLKSWATLFLDVVPENARFLLNFLLIARRVGIIMETKKVYESDFEDLCILCYMSGHEKEQFIFKPYLWLSSWIKYRNLQFENEPKKLLEIAINLIMDKGLRD